MATRKKTAKKKARKKTAKKNERITRAELSRRLKKSTSYISRLTKKGVFKIGVDGKVDFAEASKAYESFVDPNYIAGKKTGKEENGFAKSRANKEYFAAEIAKLDYQERTGELISRKIVEKQQFEAARACRDALLSMPGRLAAELVSMEDRKEIAKLLESALTEALERLSAE